MTSITVSFTLDSERDKRILRWLKNMPRGERSRAIRLALAAHLGHNVTLADVYEAIQELGRCGVVVSSQDDTKPPPDVPPDVLENLAKLGL